MVVFKEKTKLSKKQTWNPNRLKIKKRVKKQHENNKPFTIKLANVKKKHCIKCISIYVSPVAIERRSATVKECVLITSSEHCFFKSLKSIPMYRRKIGSPKNHESLVKFIQKMDRQTPIGEEDKNKTAFITHIGLYEWNKCIRIVSFGSTIQR